MIFGLVAGLMLCSAPAFAQDDEEEGGEEATEAAAPKQGGSLQRSNRMEFDARLVRGERAGSGAVFLFQRAPRALPSMVPLRQSYLHDSVSQVLGDRGTEQLTESKAKALKDAVEERQKKLRNTEKALGSDNSGKKKKGKSNRSRRGRR